MKSGLDIPVVAGDNDTTSTRFLTLLHEIDLIETFTLVCSLELFSKVIVSDTSGVHDRFWGQNVLQRNTK